MLLAIAVVTGCALMSTATFYGGMYRAHRDGVRFRRTYEHLQADVPFSCHSDVTLDLYGQADGSGYPVLIFVHGGGWNSYDKELFTAVAMQLLPQKAVHRQLSNCIYGRPSILPQSTPTAAISERIRSTAAS